MRVLRQFQDLIGTIYDLPLGVDVRDFLVTDARAAQACGTDEALLVAAQDDGLGVALYVDAAVLERLDATNPVEALSGANLADCWTALEGVSHFVYLAFNAHHDRAVSRLELETQAEVDKYVVSLWLLHEQSPERFPSELHALLFRRCRIDERLAAGHVGLYAAASRYAARFCRRLERRMRSRVASARAEATAELRRFYRLNDARKLAHIDRCA